MRFWKLPHLSLVLVLTLLVPMGCGLKSQQNLAPKTKTVAPVSNLLSEEGGCDLNTTPATQEALSLVEQFYKRTINFIGRYNQKFSASIIPPQTVGTGNHLLTTPLKPMILTTDLIYEELKDLEEEFKNRTTPNNIDDTDLIELEESSGFKPFARRLNALLIKARRLQSLSCQRKELAKKKERDVRAYYRFQKDPSNELGLCEEVVGSSICELEKLLLKRKGKEELFVANYTRAYIEKVDSFFKFEPKTQFSCSKKEQNILEIPLSFDERFVQKINGSFQSLNVFAASKWSNDKFRVNFIPYTAGIHDQKVEIKWSDSFLSYVRDDEPYTIYLSPFLNYERTLITFAHELGHVLGFPDCYHEFYDASEKAIIYYTLDETGSNLMCHLSPMATIPDSYLTQLEKKYCL